MPIGTINMARMWAIMWSGRFIMPSAANGDEVAYQSSAKLSSESRNCRLTRVDLDGRRE
jgi:hypothetical protein